MSAWPVANPMTASGKSGEILVNARISKKPAAKDSAVTPALAIQNRGAGRQVSAGLSRAASTAPISIAHKSVGPTQKPGEVLLGDATVLGDGGRTSWSNRRTHRG